MYVHALALFLSLLFSHRDLANVLSSEYRRDESKSNERIRRDDVRSTFSGNSKKFEIRNSSSFWPALGAVLKFAFLIRIVGEEARALRFAKTDRFSDLDSLPLRRATLYNTTHFCARVRATRLETKRRSTRGNEIYVRVWPLSLASFLFNALRKHDSSPCAPVGDYRLPPRHPSSRPSFPDFTLTRRAKVSPPSRLKIPFPRGGKDSGVYLYIGVYGY